MIGTGSSPLNAGAKGAVAALNRAALQFRRGELADAEWTLRQLLAEAPGSVPALTMLADVALHRGQREEATMLLKRAVISGNDAGDLRWRLTNLLAEQGEMDAARAELALLSPELRSGPNARKLESSLLGELGLVDPQIATLRTLLSEQPEDAEAWQFLGIALKTSGDLAGAVEAFRRAIRIRPSFGEAYWNLANLKTVKFDDRDLSAMRKALRGKLAHQDALHFHFALGKALEDRDQFERSFRHYDQGNALRAAQLPRGAMAITPRVDVAIATFDPALFDRFDGAGDPSDAPIFVVGLQRSGSTLIEQILASHPLIEGTSELMAMEKVWARVGQMCGRSGNPFAELPSLDRETLAKLGAEYLDGARAFRKTDKPMFVDKLPANWLNVGFIRLILPNARIVDARRFPMAAGFSNFKQHYARGVTFSYSQQSIGRFYADYLRLMRHFDALLPGFVHHLLNERLIDDPEGETRRLLAYVGVPFDEACLNFHANKRAVHTPSAEQVRRPINRDGVDYWRRYERWLDPMKEALGDALDRWDEVPG